MELQVLLMLSLTASCMSYSIKYFDCTDIEEVQTYKIKNSCEVGNNTTNHKLKEYTILQDRSVSEIQGFSCRVTRSTITEYCGSFSHNKLAKAPDIEIHQTLDIEQCLHLVNTQVFLGKDIKIGAENIIHNADLGVIMTNDNEISCRGQSMKFGNNIVNDILQVSQYKIIVAKEKFNVNIQRSQVESMSNHEMLPISCGPESGGCQIADKTYVWTLPSAQCSLEKIRSVTLKEYNGYLIDETHKILLKKGTKVPANRGCPTQAIYQTEYPHLYLSETANWPGPIMGNDLDLEVYIKGRDDYLMFKLEEKINMEDGILKKKSCEDSITHQLDQGELIHIEDNTFMKRNGDTVEKFRCKQNIGILTEMEACYDAIPITTGFVKTSNRVFTPHSAKKPCNLFFGLKIHTLDNVWVEINPHIKEMKEPRELPLLEHDFQHEDLSQGGIYTEGELEAWRQHIELGDYHDAISRTISYGVCTHQGDCGMSGGLQPYDLQNLYPEALIKEFNPWKKFNKWIETWGTYICLLALLVEAVHLITWGTALAQTIIYDGVDGLKALLYLLCCKPMQTSQVVNRRHQRIKRKEKSNEYQEAVDTSPAEETMGLYTINEQS